MDYEVIKDRLYLRVLQNGLSAASRLADSEHCFGVDDALLYFPFFLDYGPLSLGNLYKFCQTVNGKLTDKQLYGKKIVLCTASKMATRHNAVYLLAAHSLLCLGRSPEEAMRPFARMSPPLAAWHDASPTVDTFHLSTLDVLRGIAKAVAYKFFDMDSFDLWEYEHYERVEHGDMNWLVQGRFLAFAGPHDTKVSPVEGYHCTSVEDLLPYFKSKGVTAVVRLNKKYYNERRFMHVAIAHHDMYYLDGSNPPEHILQRFLAVTEATSGAIAVHCKAGLGRTGTCIGAYMMKHYRMTAREVIGWMRVCRPGSVIGPQQQFMEEIQQRMWEDGEYFRTMKTVPLPAPGSPLLTYAAVAGQAAGAAQVQQQQAQQSEVQSKGSRASDGIVNQSTSPALPSQGPLSPGARTHTTRHGAEHSSLYASSTQAASSSPYRRAEERPSPVSPTPSPGRTGTLYVPHSPARAGGGTGTMYGVGAAASAASSSFSTRGGGLYSGSPSTGYQLRSLASPSTSPIAFAATGSLQRRTPTMGLGAGAAGSVGSPPSLYSSRPTTTSGTGGMASMLAASTLSSQTAVYGSPKGGAGGGIPGQGELLRSAKARNSPVSPMTGGSLASAAHTYRMLAAQGGR